MPDECRLVGVCEFCGGNKYDLYESSVEQLENGTEVEVEDFIMTVCDCDTRQ